MKKTIKKSVKKYGSGGNTDRKSDPIKRAAEVKRAVADSTLAANFQNTAAYNKANADVKKLVDLKKRSPSDARKGKETKYGSTPVKYIPLPSNKRGGSIKRKK
jgi:hypothetical protein